VSDYTKKMLGSECRHGRSSWYISGLTYVLRVNKFVSINEFHSPIMSDFAHYLGHVVLNICGKLCNHGYIVRGQ